MCQIDDQHNNNILSIILTSSAQWLLAYAGSLDIRSDKVSIENENAIILYILDGFLVCETCQLLSCNDNTTVEVQHIETMYNIVSLYE